MIKQISTSSIKFVVPTFVGFWIYFIWAMYMEWIEPIWWGGGKSFLLGAYFTLFLLIVGIPAYLLFLNILAKIRKSEELSSWDIFVGGIIHGFMVFPILFIILLKPYRLFSIRTKFPENAGLDVLIVFIIIILSLIVSVTISTLVVFLIGRLKRLCKKPSEMQIL
ncbi:MAG: hypothetical protein HY036_11900 [Nitrospirae bacterium]|nr:hypothetical protein [Nitrospirota bacterium]